MSLYVQYKWYYISRKFFNINKVIVLNIGELSKLLKLKSKATRKNSDDAFQSTGKYLKSKTNATSCFIHVFNRFRVKTYDL